MSDYACPRCRSALAVIRGQEGLLYPCAQCDGVALALSVLKKRGHPALMETLWSRVLAHEAIGGFESCGCPICRHEMKRVIAAGEKNALEIDACVRCQFLWLDAGEIQGFGQAPRVTTPAQKEIDLAGERLRRALREERHVSGGWGGTWTTPSWGDWALWNAIEGVLDVLVWSWKD